MMLTLSLPFATPFCYSFLLLLSATPVMQWIRAEMLSLSLSFPLYVSNPRDKLCDDGTGYRSLPVLFPKCNTPRHLLASLTSGESLLIQIHYTRCGLKCDIMRAPPKSLLSSLCLRECLDSTLRGYKLDVGDTGKRHFPYVSPWCNILGSASCSIYC